MTSSERITLSKAQALDLVKQGQLAAAVLSLVDDLGKHPETRQTRPLLALSGMRAIEHGEEGVRQWIEAFYP